MTKMTKLIITVPVLLGFCAPLSVAGAGDMIAVISLKGPLGEQPDSLGLGQFLGSKAPANMFDLLKKMRAARSDPDLRAVIIEIDQAGLGLAQIQELRRQFESLRAADKDVWVFSEGLSNGTLLLGSAASHLILVPSGDVSFNGLYAEALYFKNLLDKLKLKADILHCGAFKSAGEPFYRTGPSKEAEEQESRLLDSVFDQILQGVAKSRNKSPKQMRQLVDVGIFSATEALNAKLIDKLMYREDFVNKIKQRYGEDIKIEFNYGSKKGPEIDFENPFGVFKFIGDMLKGPTESDKAAIAVVYVEGTITSGETEQSLLGGSSNAGSATIRKAIAKATADKNVKALILRVDSPGGSALASDVICEATKRFKQTGRPLIVSMGNVAASGGYYVSSLADTIFAEPGTITGSIGVVGGKYITKGLWDWVGVTSHEYKRGRYADLMNTNRPFSEQERKVVLDTMYRVYGEFKDRVVQGRGAKLKGEIESLAGGRVYTGAEALEIGLVDRLGGFADAIKFAADKADLSDYELRVFPRPKSIFEMLSNLFGGKETEDQFVRLTAGPRSGLGLRLLRLGPSASLIESLKTLDPQKAKIIQNFLVQLELFSKEQVLLIGPTSTLLIR